MSLDSFFDTLDTETKFTAWKSSTTKKLNYLIDIIPTENIIELRYINETIELINILNLGDNNENKTNIKERLYNCNIYYRKFGN